MRSIKLLLSAFVLLILTFSCESQDELSDLNIELEIIEDHSTKSGDVIPGEYIVK